MCWAGRLTRAGADPDLLTALGHIQYELQDYQPAAATYTRLLEIDPSQRVAQFNLGVCLAHLKEWERAAQCFQEASGSGSLRSEALLGMGTCLTHLERPDEALGAFNAYLLKYPEHEQALFGKAVSLQQAGRNPEAVELYRRVLAGNPNSEPAHANLIAMFLKTRDYASVRRHAESAAEDPARRRARPGSAGHCRFRRGRLPECRAILQNAGGTGPRALRKLVQPGRRLP